MGTQVVHDHILTFFPDVAVLVDALQQIGGTDVGRHDQNGILEVHRSALGVRDPAIIQHLQQHVEHVRVRFLNLIKEDNGVRFSPDSLCQLAAFLVSHISRRRSDQSGHGVFLHVLTHIDTHHILFIVEQAGCQRLGKLCFADTGRS